jgi:hypothetical protein
MQNANAEGLDNVYFSDVKNPKMVDIVLMIVKKSMRIFSIMFF